MNKKIRRNNEERRMWVMNDAGMYEWWTRTRLPLIKFVQDNREQIDHLIDRELNKEPRL